MNAKIGIVTGIILTVVGLIAIFMIVGQSSTILTTSANSITDANNCSSFTDGSGAVWNYNITSKDCYNLTSQGTQTARQYDLPLNTLFSASGVLLIIFMAMLFLGAMGWIILRVRK